VSIGSHFGVQLSSRACAEGLLAHASADLDGVTVDLRLEIGDVAALELAEDLRLVELPESGPRWHHLAA
jgi:hypothetical protein